MEQTYLTVARQGKNRLRDYIVGILLIFSITMIPAILSLIIMAIFTPYPANIAILEKGGVDRFIYGDKFHYLIFAGAAFAGIILGIFLAVTRVHGRRFLTLIAPDESIS